MTLHIKRAVAASKMGKPKPIWLQTLSQTFPPLNFPKKSKKPPKIIFPEDTYRRLFYKNFPAENRHPQCLDERIPIKEKVLDEQRNLMNQGKSPSKAYQAAIHKFKIESEHIEMQERVALEEKVSSESYLSTRQLFRDDMEEEKRKLDKE